MKNSISPKLIDSALNDSQKIFELLTQKGCFSFPQLPSGMFPATQIAYEKAQFYGYGDAWLRDTAFIGLMLLKTGQTEVAQSSAKAILDCLHKIESYFNVSEPVKAGHFERPPIRFRGANSQPVTDWANAQNDALGYCLYFIANSANAGFLKLDSGDKLLIKNIISYLNDIEFWQDQDSGHWEEIPKCNASSIGVVVAGLRAIKDYVDLDDLDISGLINRGQKSLDEILPNESKTPGRERAHDAALLFLIEPLEIIKGSQAEKIINGIEKNLVGEKGIRRYNGDSYWGPDYKEHFLSDEVSSDFSSPERMAERDAFLKPGQEARWTLFDPLLATYYLKLFRRTQQQDYSDKAHLHLERSLSMVCPYEDKMLIPEAYYLKNGEWVPNDNLGLLWSQANLMYALHVLTC